MVGSRYYGLYGMKMQVTGKQETGRRTQDGMSNNAEETATQKLKRTAPKGVRGKGRRRMETAWPWDA